MTTHIEHGALPVEGELQVAGEVFLLEHGKKRSRERDGGHVRGGR